MVSSAWRVACLTGVFVVSALSFLSSPALAQGFTQTFENEKQGTLDRSEVIFACVKSDGLRDRDPDDGILVRLVAAQERCRRGEVKIHWNVTGPQGPQGLQGFPG